MKVLYNTGCYHVLCELNDVIICRGDVVMV